MMYMKKKDSWMKYKSLVFLYTSCCSLVLCVPYWTFVAKLPPCILGSWGALVTSGPLNPHSVEGSIWCSLNSVSSTLLNYYRNNNSEFFFRKTTNKKQIEDKFGHDQKIYSGYLNVFGCWLSTTAIKYSIVIPHTNPGQSWLNNGTIHNQVIKICRLHGKQIVERKKFSQKLSRNVC